MIAYTSVGTNDFDAALTFYDAFFEPMKAKRLFASERFATYGRAPGTPMFGVCTPFDGEVAAPGNGAMVALSCRNADQVRDGYARALELGGSDEGEPGPRGGGQFFMAYFRDPDGNKIALYAPAQIEAAT